MIVLIGGLILLASALSTRYMSGSWVAPVPTYCAVWGSALVGCSFFGPLFRPLFPLDERVVLFYVLGAFVFSLGAWVPGFWGPATGSARARYQLRAGAFGVITFAVVLTLPFAYWHVMDILAGVPITDVLFYARMIDVNASKGVGQSIFGPYANLITLSIAAAIVAYTVSVEGWLLRCRQLIFFVAALAPTLAGGRSASVGFIFSVVALIAFRGELRVKKILGLAGVFFLLFFGVALLVKKGVSLESSRSEQIVGLLQGLRDYAFGGVTAFQRVLLSPGEVPSTSNVTRTALEALNHLGAHYTVPPLHAAFSTIGESVATNVYTTYFSYLDFGFIGATALVFAYGMVVGWMYRLARAGNAICLALYASLFAGMVLSVFGEGFYSNINFLAKLTLCSFVLLKRAPTENHALNGSLRSTELDRSEVALS